MTSLIASDVGIAGRLASTDLMAQAGQRIALVGPNGGGKTSLLRALARIEPAAGRVVVDGEDIDRAPMARRRRLLALLPASRELAWPIAARDVIRLGLDTPDELRVTALVEEFELEALVERPVDRLSTGERARVLMARAIAARPSLLLLDEPLSNLDPYWVLRFLDLFDREARRGGTLLVALHDLSQLPRFDRALLIAEGRVQKDEAPGGLVASGRFADIMQVRREGDGWAIRPPADRRSSP